MSDSLSTYFEQLRAESLSSTYRNNLYWSTDEYHRRIQTTPHQSKVRPMSDADKKIKFLHRKIVTRYLEAPTSDDESMIKLMDLNITNPQTTYQGMGFMEHPVHIRHSWVSQAAANLTDLGYWPWVHGKIREDKTYRMTVDSIVEQSDPGIPVDFFDMPNAPATPVPATNPWDNFGAVPAGPAPVPMPQPATVRRSRQEIARDRAIEILTQQQPSDDDSAAMPYQL